VTRAPATQTLIPKLIELIPRPVKIIILFISDN
jgi:hypothetical protein